MTVGVDFGTLSARAALVEVESGREVAWSEYEYDHGVISRALPESAPDGTPGGGTHLPPDFALQDPADYIRAIHHTVSKVAQAASPDDIIGIGIDFTSCTVLPAFADGRPLCQDARFRDNPFAWVQLWKQLAARHEAAELTALLAAQYPELLARYGGQISPAWLFPKVWHMLREAPEVYQAADRFLEAGDWIVWYLTGQERRSACAAGYKALWDPVRGYPEAAFLATADVRLRHVVEEKLSADLLPVGARAGGLRPEVAAGLGLRPGLPVAAAHIDAHAAVPASTVVEPGKMVMVMGTSICHMVLSERLQPVEGVAGIVADGIVPGYYGYEAGQAAAGDLLNWFVENWVPGSYQEAARREGVSVFEFLEARAGTLQPGASGLLALDWWNGNRSILGNAALSGLIVGFTLQTKPEEVYRALIEALAFGSATIIQAFERAQVPVRELYACGGLANRSPLVMQTFADVTGRTIQVAASSGASALGSAMFAAVAAGAEAGGYADIRQAAANMARLKPDVFRPHPQRHRQYQRLYEEYTRLHDYFGRGANPVMERLLAFRQQAGSGN